MYKYFLLLLFVCYVLADVHKISLRKRVSKKWQFLKQDKSNLELKHKFHPRLLSNSRQQSDKIPIYYTSEAYFINITIGTPPQPFEVLVDTGSSDLIVQDSTCRNQEESACNSDKFYSSRSSTYKFITNGSNEYYDYIIGQDTPAAINQSLLNPPIFTIYLNPNVYSNQTDQIDNAGAITFGGLDTDNCGQIIAYQPLSSLTYYQFTVSGISIGNYSSKKSFQAISDTTFHYIGGPKAVLDVIAKQIGATDDNGNYFIDCNVQIPNFTVIIGNYQYSIDSNHQKVEVSGSCYWNVADTEAFGLGPVWVLGTPFIQEYCNIYDMGNKRIGFAKAKNA